MVETSEELSGLVAGDSAICGRLAALILRLRPAGLRFEEFRSSVKRGGGLCPLPSSRGPPDNGNLSACLGRVRGAVQPVLSCHVLYMYTSQRVKEMRLLPAKQWDN